MHVASFLHVNRYVPREWMLVSAYTKAMDGDHSEVKELQQLFEDPFGEQPQFEVEKFVQSLPMPRNISTARFISISYILILIIYS